MQPKQLNFIRQQIAQLNTALFFSNSQGGLPFQAYLIEALKTDDDGYVWFFISKNSKQVVENDQAFPARLEFYRKGHLFSVDVEGNACIVTNKRTIASCMDELPRNYIIGTKTAKEVVLLKVQMEKCIYRELLAPTRREPFSAIGGVLKNLFYANQEQWQAVG